MAWLGTWANRKELLIVDTNIDDNLSSFPVLLILSASSGVNNDDVTEIFDELGSDANRKKIAVTSSDGTTQLYVEIERWDDANEVAYLWVKVPSVLASGGATIYIYYDSAQEDNLTYVGDTAECKLAVNINTIGTYDTVDVGRPSVINDGGTYKMWYEIYNGSNFRIGYCTSTDNITWSNHQVVMNPGNIAADASHVYKPCVIKDGSTYKMWYSGNDGSGATICYATSANGTTWANHQEVVPQSSEGTYDQTWAHSCCVILDGSTYKMWYSGYSNAYGKWKIIYCTSANGTSWSGFTVVVDEAEEGTYDANGSLSPYVTKVDSTYYMHYTGRDASNKHRVIYCDSSNGTTWANYLLIGNVSNEGSYDANQALEPCILYDGGHFKIYYTAEDVGGIRRIVHRQNENANDDYSKRVSENVWDSNFFFVGHMAQDPNGDRSVCIKDSTSNLNRGTPSGSMTTADLVNGQIDKAIEFDGSNDRISIGNISAKGVFTVEFSGKHGSSAWCCCISKYSNNASSYADWIVLASNAEKVDFVTWVDGYEETLSVNTFTVGVNFYGACSFDTDNKKRVYLDGNLEATSAAKSTDVDTHSQPIVFGAHTIGGSPTYYPGILDEIRLSSIARSDAWIKATSYSNVDNLVDFDPVVDVEITADPLTITLSNFGDVVIDVMISASAINIPLTPLGTYIGGVLITDSIINLTVSDTGSFVEGVYVPSTPINITVSKTGSFVEGVLLSTSALIELGMSIISTFTKSIKTDWTIDKDRGPWSFTKQPKKLGYINNPLWSEDTDVQTFLTNNGIPIGSTKEHKPCGHWHNESIPNEPQVWPFTEQPDKFGYLNNPNWSEDPDTQDFLTDTLGLPVGSTKEHKPCGHWHKVPLVEYEEANRIEDLTLLDLFEYDTINSSNQIVLQTVHPGVLAIFYNAWDAVFKRNHKLITVGIDEDGNLGPVLDSADLGNNNNNVELSLNHVTGSIYAVGYSPSQIGVYNYVVNTYRIDSDGTITALDSNTFLEWRYSPKFFKVHDGVFLLSGTKYIAPTYYLYIVTFTINASGTIGTSYISTQVVTAPGNAWTYFNFFLSSYVQNLCVMTFMVAGGASMQVKCISFSCDSNGILSSIGQNFTIVDPSDNVVYVQHSTRESTNGNFFTLAFIDSGSYLTYRTFRISSEGNINTTYLDQFRFTDKRRNEPFFEMGYGISHIISYDDLEGANYSAMAVIDVDENGIITREFRHSIQIQNTGINLITPKCDYSSDNSMYIVAFAGAQSDGFVATIEPVFITIKVKKTQVSDKYANEPVVWPMN